MSVVQLHPCALRSRTQGYRAYPYIFWVRNVRHFALAVAQIHRVHAASLRALARATSEAAKQEAPGVDAPKASTAHIWYQQNARALDAQSDTNHRP
jgi:hypothetical protein